MNCREAQDRIPFMWDAPPTSIERVQFQEHIEHCASCRREWELWEESSRLMRELEIEISEESAEAVNQKVMERIYLESPWLMPGDGKSAGSAAITRRRLSWWIACFMAVFISSLLYVAFIGSEDQPLVQGSGITETGIAGSSNSFNFAYPVDSYHSGIMEPLVANMGPLHPEYWMMVSTLGIILAAFLLFRLNRYRRI